MTAIEHEREPDDAREASWETHMRRGDFAAAWRVADAVLKQRGDRSCWHLPRHQQWVWRGASLANQRVLIRCYHGLGDTIQFIRFAPLVRELAREVIVEAQPALLPLLRTAAGIDRLVPLTDGHPDVEDDVDHVAPLASIPKLELHILQRGRPVGDWPRQWGAVSGIDDIVGAAGVMRGLDLVVTVDSMPAHLAGALGVTVWTLLHARADWRWMDDRDDSPWYPTMRLFRQPRAGDWGAVIDRVRAELELLVRQLPGDADAIARSRERT